MVWVTAKVTLGITSFGRLVYWHTDTHAAKRTFPPTEEYDSQTYRRYFKMVREPHASLPCEFSCTYPFLQALYMKRVLAGNSTVAAVLPRPLMSANPGVDGRLERTSSDRREHGAV
jgi:hypothetical protein